MISIKYVLLIIEVLLLVDGLWAIIFGKLPAGLFNFLFGLGEYKFPPNQTRLFGLLLSSPIPVSYLVSLLLTGLFGAKGIGYATIFTIIYILIIITASIIIVRKAKDPKTKKKR
jgi:predicted permease